MNAKNNNSGIEMFYWKCLQCGCIQSMPNDLNEHLRQTGGRFFCVNGHSLYYPIIKQKDELEEKLMNEYFKNAQLENVIKNLEVKLSQLILLMESNGIKNKKKYPIKNIYHFLINKIKNQF